MSVDFNKTVIGIPLALIIGGAGIAGGYYLDSEYLRKANAQELLDPVYMRQSAYWEMQFNGRIAIFRGKIRDIIKTARREGGRDFTVYESEDLEDYQEQILQLETKIGQLK